MFVDGNEGKSLTCMNLYFSSLCMMMGRMTDGREEKEKDVNRKKRMAWRTDSVYIYILIPGAAMVIREMTTWVMPFAAAFYRRDTTQVKIIYIQ